MPINSAPYYFAQCDNCGNRADYDEFTAFGDPGQAADMAIEGEWTRKGGVFHCPACPSLDEDDEDDESEVPA